MEPTQAIMEESKHSGKSQQPRKRKKQYYNRIRHQMEFYFGDANLSKDRFLNKLLAVNPYVPLDVFMTFNKIKELANGVDELQKAIESSEMLELSDDKRSVRRTTEIKKKDDLDEYMVYVEALPPTATHESIKHQFKQFGNVAYVSLPKYRTSGRIKEFAFIEFEDKSSVEKCINSFRQFDGVINDAQDAENLTSVVSYVKEQEDLENAENKPVDCDKSDESKSNVTNENENEIKANDKRENEDEVKGTSKKKIQKEEVGDERSKEEQAATSDSDEVPPAKRVRLEEPEAEAEVETEVETEVAAGGGDEEDGGDGDGEAEQDQEQEKDSQDNTDEKASVTDDNQDLKKKRRRRRKQNPSTSAKNTDSAVKDETKPADDPTKALSTLRVATKVEWKRLRNKYLMLQRQKYTEVKKLLQQNKHGDNRKVSTLPLSTVRPVTMKNKKYDSPPPSKKICTRNINFYGAMRDEKNTYECSIIDENKPNASEPEEDEVKNEKQFGKDLQFEFEPGLIVKVNFDEPCTDTADFKAEMKQYAFVRYVDIKEGQTYAFVRVDTPRSAPVLIKHCAPNRCQILTGESETDYWSKISKDREQKLSKKVKVPKARSRKMRNIIKNIAEVNVITGLDNKTIVTHIRFDDD